MTPQSFDGMLPFSNFLSAQLTAWLLGVTQKGQHNRLTAQVYGDRGYDGCMPCYSRQSGPQTGLKTDNWGRI